MGFISTIQHDGRLFIAGQPRRASARPHASWATRAPATVADGDWKEAAWLQVQAVVTTLWQTARRNVLAAVERVGPEVASGGAGPVGTTATARPLRVLHVVDPSSRGAGRMVISGRMADVCAELERLAACEARHARC